jgi:hypothetical protein
MGKSAMFTGLAAVLSSGGFGAVTGLFGGLAQKWMGLKQQKQEAELRIDLAKLSLQEAKLEQDHALAMADKQLEITQSEGEIAAEIADSELLGVSIVEASKDSGIGWVEGVKHLMRPVITVFLLIQVEFILWAVWGKVDGLNAMSADQQYELFSEIVAQMVFLTVTAVSWWFASRPSRNK